MTRKMKLREFLKEYQINENKQSNKTEQISRLKIISWNQKFFIFANVKILYL